MRLLQRLLRGPHQRRGRHLDSCAECQLQQRRERQYLERLRGADVPVASDDLTARLLARTAELARTEQPATPRPAAACGFRPALRATFAVAGGAAAAAALLGGSAYLMGGDPAPAAGEAPASALLQRDLLAAGADPGADAVEAGAGAPAGWSLTGEPDFTPAGTLTRAQLTTLRSDGWACPELRDLGYHLVWARSRVMNGGDILELRLTDGRHFATILEQHGVPGVGAPGQPAVPGSGPLTGPPLNVLTGRPAASDGFTSTTVPAGNAAPGAAPESGAGRGTLWVNHAAPFAAIYQAGETTFTYVSDQPAEQADDGVAALVRSRTVATPGTAAGWGAAPEGPADGPGAVAGDGAGSGAGSSFVVRMERGLGRIVELLAP